MPVEIKELIIRAVTAPGDNETGEIPQGPMDSEERDAMIQEVVEQVMKILEKKKDR